MTEDSIVFWVASHYPLPLLRVRLERLVQFWEQLTPTCVAAVTSWIQLVLQVRTLQEHLCGTSVNCHYSQLECDWFFAQEEASPQDPKLCASERKEVVGLQEALRQMQQSIAVLVAGSAKKDTGQ